jgi:predicted AlkP superfamily pyrophosphatase or phosphodiesterase
MRLRGRFVAATVVALAAFAAASFLFPLAASAPASRHAIVVSIDGLMPASYTEPDAHGLKVPTLRILMDAGAWSPGVHGVLPAVTYPSHTTMVTGVTPGRHGIISNAVFDPTGVRDGEWHWYEQEIRVPTLWQLARAQGLRTAMIGWPVTMGAQGDAVLPEFWRGRGIDGAKLMRAIATPGLFAEVAKRFPAFEAGFDVQPVKDESLTDIAVDMIEREKPNLLLLHIADVDHQQHEKGPWSPEAVAAIETADAQVARVVLAAKHAGIWNDTLFLVVSDHGFARQQKLMRPGVLLREHGLIGTDPQTHSVSWRAQVLSSGGSAYIYLRDPKDEEAAAVVSQVFRALAGQPGSGIRRLLAHDEIVAMGGDPQAFVAIEAADGFGFAGGITGDAIVPATSPGLHGFCPDQEAMNSSLIMNGMGVRGGKIDGARLVDVGPTVAQWLSLRMENVDGHPLAAIHPMPHSN